MLRPLTALVASTVFVWDAGWAHEPAERPPPIVTRPTPAILGSIPGPTPLARGVRPLRDLAAEATAVVVGRVARTEAFDQDRLRVQRVDVERVLRGRLDAREIGVVEMRGASRRPSLLDDGQTVVLLVSPAPALSYLAQHLRDGTFVVPTGGRDGVVVVGSEAELAAIEAALTAGDDTPAARRGRAFAALDGPSQRLAADAVVELRALPALSPLAGTECATLARVLGDPRTPPPTRIAVVGLLADRDARDALPAVTSAATDTAAVLDAVLAARARLGAPATLAELAPSLQSPDAGIRAAAARALAATADPGVTTLLGSVAATDPDASVRGAAIDTLGTTGRADALPVLSKTFASRERDLQQRSARAIMAIGGSGADDALVALALHGERPDVRTYAAIVLLAARGADSAAVRRLATSRPPPEVSHVLEHGLEVGHHHATD